MLDQSNPQYPNVWPASLNVMHTTKINTLPVQRGYTYLLTLAARRRNHLSNENLKTLFFLAALKLPAKNLCEYEQEITVVEGEAKSTVILYYLTRKDVCCALIAFALFLSCFT